MFRDVFESKNGFQAAAKVRVVKPGHYRGVLLPTDCTELGGCVKLGYIILSVFHYILRVFSVISLKDNQPSKLFWDPASRLSVELNLSCAHILVAIHRSNNCSTSCVRTCEESQQA